MVKIQNDPKLDINSPKNKKKKKGKQVSLLKTTCGMKSFQAGWHLKCQLSRVLQISKQFQAGREY